MSESTLSRRKFFERAALLGASTAGALYLAGCDRSNGDAAPAADLTEDLSEGGCDISNLTDAEKSMRANLDYVDQTPDPEQTCANCQLYVEPEGDALCGGCELPNLGPVHPEGWCSSWAPTA